MKKVLFIISLFIGYYNITIAQTDTLAQHQPTKRIEQKQKNAVTPKTATKEKSVDPIPSRYIYKLKNRKTKSKFWYNPNEQQQPLDYYIAQGWSVVKMKKLDQPPLMEKLMAWSQVIMPIVKDNLIKKKEGE